MLKSAQFFPPMPQLGQNEAYYKELVRQADLVFVDPIGTGFSRPTRAEYGTEFYGTLGDIAARRTDADATDDLVTTGRGRLVYYFRNEKNGRVFRYLRIYTLVVASGTCTYSA